MIVYALEEHFEGDAGVEIVAWVVSSKVDVGFVKAF